jgi:hypothetical protein
VFDQMWSASGTSDRLTIETEVYAAARPSN